MANGETFEQYRPRLFAVAYRMLGSASEAEDAVQDAWLRFAGADQASVRTPEAFLTTIVTRLCLDRLKSARMQREQYVGPWLPEPLITDTAPGPEQSAALAESVTLAFMVLLETLSPEERAAFLLREVFDYDHREIASMLNTTPENSRQLVHRARARVDERRPHIDAGYDAERHRPLVHRFAMALRDGDAAAFTSLLAEDVEFWSDGGGKVSAARRPVFGRHDVTQVLVGIRRSGLQGVSLDQVSLDFVDVNGEPAVTIRVDGRLDTIFTCTIANDAITALRIIRNPDKLQYIARQMAEQ
ncbi:MAG TPA: RNA polymerase sigma-70 factor [Vicinamibacterales bacterium]|jgi:RNA polymerase sigma-70 factor (ECF subfamily)